ncbi:50S ribosomal protein L19, chloroplastic-like [Syzygium oleosum]|uniref:50S ribosomal protein L19, chloroplastic-like n=1 Tax=Syzygium oleosum TaxID=219896 RepID=UPI0011D2712A|nr:50S ribosomal protein L19, chloroplastic-like [Syzygium oleosum]
MQFLRRGIGAPQWRAVGGGAGFPARNAASFGSASTTGSQTAAPTLARDVPCPTPWLCNLWHLPSFFSRCITTAGDSVKAPLRDSSVHLTDVPPRIKFKRLDKTARNIMKILDKEAVEEVKARRDIPDIRAGYLVRMKVEVPENKRRLSTLEGIVIARRNAGLNSTFRIRRLVAGVGIESLFPLYSPNIKEIKVLDKRKVRRAKLYYLRERLNPLKKK